MQASGKVVLGSLATLATLLLAGCGRQPSAPNGLADGSPARIARVPFEGVEGPTVLTHVRRTTLDGTAVDARVASCLREGWSEPAAGKLVHRVTTDGESVTFVGSSGRTLQACDGARGARTRDRPWCGHAYGRLSHGRLLDPRLDLGGCTTSDGRDVGFVWVEPRPGARFVVVTRHGFSEAYPTAGPLPVRISATEGLDTARSTAALEVSEHAGDGRALRRYRLEARVAG